MLATFSQCFDGLNVRIHTLNGRPRHRGGRPGQFTGYPNQLATRNRRAKRQERPGSSVRGHLSIDVGAIDQMLDELTELADFVSCPKAGALPARGGMRRPERWRTVAALEAARGTPNGTSGVPPAPVVRCRHICGTAQATSRSCSISCPPYPGSRGEAGRLRGIMGMRPLCCLADSAICSGDSPTDKCLGMFPLLTGGRSPDSVWCRERDRLGLTISRILG